jgi:hypothetical protein
MQGLFLFLMDIGDLIFKLGVISSENYKFVIFIKNKSHA